MKRTLLGLLCVTTACVESTAPARVPRDRPPVVAQPSPASSAPPGVAPPAEASPAPVRWAWVLPVDHGIRADRGGAGGFLAPRAHGSHNGIDLLAPVGTPVLAPCAGKARAGQNSSHGKWVQLVCPLPSEAELEPSRRASLFFAHLSDVADLGDTLKEVPLGGALGSVGKTGNASAAIVAAHLHFELILQDSEESAAAERHSGRDQSETLAAREVDAWLGKRCLGPSGLAQKSGQLWRARRVDPFVLLTCFGAEKPAYTQPAGKLREASYPWSSAYTATSFDVDRETFRAGQ